MNKIILLSLTAFTINAMADDAVVAQDQQMISDSCSKPCNPPPPPPPEPPELGAALGAAPALCACAAPAKVRKPARTIIFFIV